MGVEPENGIYENQLITVLSVFCIFMVDLIFSKIDHKIKYAEGGISLLYNKMCTL